jgi:hypothetical protein
VQRGPGVHPGRRAVCRHCIVSVCRQLLFRPPWPTRGSVALFAAIGVRNIESNPGALSTNQMESLLQPASMDAWS